VTSVNYLTWWFIEPGHLMVFVAVAGLVARLAGRRMLAMRLLSVSALTMAMVAFTPLSSWLIAPLETRSTILPGGSSPS